MSELKFETYRMPGVNLGPPNPLSKFALHAANEVAREDFDPRIPEEEMRYIGFGGVNGNLPYTMIDQYDRKRKPMDFRAAVIENDKLRAVILLDLGGRLWSLTHKPSGRELLYVNPVFQPVNIAIRNAWFSGGVEWNFGFCGHTPFTCSPVFAARTKLDDGTPVLRIYEFERVRAMPYQVDFFAPDGSDVLYVRGRLVNHHDHEVPVYWWSNIAVPETDKTRVLVPAVSCLKNNYGGGMDMVDYPLRGGVDFSYPVNSKNSGDSFFILPEGRMPWEANADADGNGLFFASTRRLKGRKLFHWGTGPGGTRWQDFLSEPGNPYIEMQGGLARTQGSCLPMPAGEHWEWLEAYGAFESDPAVIHGPDWKAVREAAEAHVTRFVTLESLDDMEERTREMAASPPEEIVHLASGWGALELRRQKAAGEKPVITEATPFPEETLGAEQQPWLDLIEEGCITAPPASEPPVSWMRQTEWRELLTKSIDAGGGDNWFSWLQLGVLHVSHDDGDAAKAAFLKSAEATPNAWAYRCLGLLAANSDRERRDIQGAFEYYKKALALRPDHPWLAVEFGQIALRARREAELLETIGKLPRDNPYSGRLALLEATAHLELGHLEEVRTFLDSDFEMADIHEGELSVTVLWIKYHAARVAKEEGIEINDDLLLRIEHECPPPKQWDFRMKTPSQNESTLKRPRRRSEMAQ